MLASCPVRAAALRIGAAPALAAAALCFCALFFSGGFAVAPLVWIGGLAIVLAPLLAAAALLVLLPALRLDAPAAAFLVCIFALAVWVGVTTTWSLSPERSWIYTNSALVYAVFALLGVLVSALVVLTEWITAAATALLGLLIPCALLDESRPTPCSDYEPGT